MATYFTLELTDEHLFREAFRLWSDFLRHLKPALQLEKQKQQKLARKKSNVTKAKSSVKMKGPTQSQLAAAASNVGFFFFLSQKVVISHHWRLTTRLQEVGRNGP